jgi:carboxypeptidase family protein
MTSVFTCAIVLSLLVEPAGDTHVLGALPFSDTATVTVSVFDNAGAVIPNAEVTLQGKATFSAKTGQDGRVQIDLPYGNYAVTVVSPRFTSTKVPEFEVEAEKPTLNIVLPVRIIVDEIPREQMSVPTVPSDLPNVIQHKSPRVILVRKPTIVAFFAPLTDANDADQNEALADFQYYARQVQVRLRARGIEFHELYADTIRIRAGRKTITFRPEKEAAGYYLVAPGKKARVSYGVMTDHDLLELATSYFSH